jgi:glycosyltransferase involved in cell wall biosynthesis
MTIAFSVAIPAYNSAPFIGETLDAILNQTYPPAEVVVVDDGSTDETAAVLNRYVHRVRSLRITNSGPGIARKTAVELCTSAWIALCDSDDVWNPDYLDRKVRLIDRFPDINLACANFASFGPGAVPGHTHQPPTGWRETFAEAEAEDFVLLNDPYRAFLSFNIAYPSGTAFTIRTFAWSCATLII